MNIKSYIEFNKINESETPENFIKNELSMIKKKIDDMFDDITDMELQSSTLSKSTKDHKNLTVKFYDEINFYTLLFKLELSDIEDIEEMDDAVVEEIYVKFKKYTMEGMELLSTIDKKVPVDSISDDFISEIKLELDDESNGGDDDDLSIEFE
jgi:hypothetical protein